MNKIIKSSFAIFIILLLSQACSTEEETANNIENNNFELDTNLTLTKSTSKVSNVFYNMGVTNIKLVKESNSVLYKFQSVKPFITNGKLINISDYLIRFEKGMIYLQSNSDLKITLLNGKPYMQSSEYSGYINEETSPNSVELKILLLFMREMTTSSKNKINAELVINDVEGKLGCGFWDTYYVYSTGFSLSTAIGNLSDEINNYSTGLNTLDISSCSSFGGVDTSCGWDAHFCVATQAFCCG
ncbi:hypothetical protein NBT05_10040 [Aquimarina sp. ERC-38]|uniref:hypothetical protein n=1 Tax=Aquimarina sp. ERC-38 TaxID=2949996 RepID=UPI002245B90D|nr:hypothetical protein [Aquimarina sp. ERC-38]UZO79310.1 hypothetical protein NBT05_10040 [Aquimarina sp. ERC-38]